MYVKTSLAILIPIFLVSFFIDFYLSKNKKRLKDFLRNYIRGFTLILLGIIISLVLVNIILEEEKKNISVDQFRQRIEGLDLFLSRSIDEYLIISDMIINFPGTNGVIQIEKNFEFEKLSNIFNPSLLRSDRFNIFLYESYFNKQDKILEIVKDYLLNGDFTHSEELNILFLDYMREVEQGYNPFWELEKIAEWNKEEWTSEWDRKEWSLGLLKNYDGPMEINYEKRMSGVTSEVDSYIRLYELMRYHLDFIEQYRNIIELIHVE